MRSRGNLIFTLVDREFYETIDRYQFNPKDYLDIVRGIVGKERRFGRKGIWMHCVSPQGEHPDQGWKIHVSATPKNAQEVLKSVVPIVHRTNTNFKFAIDSRILLLMNGKNWARGGAGKFITIYPSSTEGFLSLLEELHAATSSFEGPYILSDRRYPASKVIHYRYGGLQLRDRFDIKGEKTPVIVSPYGEEVADRRTPFFQLPPWASDPVQPLEPPETSVTLKDGRYKVEQALSFSNCGGVYQAIDSETGEKVIIKEARPHLGWTSLGNDAISLLEKEYRLLKKLESTGVAPRPIDLF